MRHSGNYPNLIPITKYRERRLEQRQLDLAFAVSADSATRILALIRAGGDANSVCSKGESLLLRATRLNALQSVKTLLACGADPNLPSPEGITPLLRSALLGLSDCAKLLILAGADVNQRDVNENTPLCLAARHGHLACLKTLLAMGANPNRSGGDHLWVPLMFAARFSHTEAVKALIEAGASVEAVDAAGRSVMYFAAWGDDSEAICLLKKHGADPKGQMPFSPLKVALANASDSSSCVRLLLSFDGVEVPENLNHQESQRLFKALWELTNPDAMTEFIVGPVNRAVKGPYLRLI